MSEIMKIIHERKMKKTKTKQNKKDRKEQGVIEAIMKGWELNDFVVHLSFFQLICKASLTFKLNLELPLSIILKQRELYESDHVAVECKCSKI